MTVTLNIDDFLTTLNHLIESANACVQDSNSFLAVNSDISELIKVSIPLLNQIVDKDDLAPEIRARLFDSLASVRALEAKANARLAWSHDFEEHMRHATVGDR